MSGAATQQRRIQLLSEEVYNRIAAGEVVERPASVLKELIENSLDAEATSVEVSVAGAGRKEICVSDNGLGMNRDDLLLAFERHATSKVASVNDLEAIRTLGFRGEALAAVASVAQIEAISKPPESPTGLRLRLTGGKAAQIEEVGAPPGTTVIVRDLFFNTPARRKFLKSTNVESSHLVNAFKRTALAYPDVRWTLTVDGREHYRLPPEALESRLLAVFGPEFSGRLQPVKGEAGRLRLSGYIAAPDLARRSRGDQYLYVNRRWVQNRLLNHAIAAAYGRLLEPGKFPLYVLFLELPHGDVDVNVHPAKTEVKFQREGELYQFILQQVGAALQPWGVQIAPQVVLRSGETLNESTGEISQAAPTAPLSLPSPQQRRFYSQPLNEPAYRAAPLEAYALAFGSQPERNVAESAEPPTAETLSSERTQVYQLHQRYILTEIQGGVALIDQHAAHERVLYERALQLFSGGVQPSQQLLFPKIIELEAEDSELLRSVLEDLQTLGITIREFGPRSFVLEALPAGIRETAPDALVLEILDELRERGATKQPNAEQLAAAFACRAAIKFGQPLTLREMNSLIDQLFASRFPFTCPHGRPTVLQLTLSELERRFGRA